MSVANLVQRLQSRPATPPWATPAGARTVRTVAPGANTTFQAVRTLEPAPILAFRPVFAPVALFAPKTVKVDSARGGSAPAPVPARRPRSSSSAAGKSSNLIEVTR